MKNNLYLWGMKIEAHRETMGYGIWKISKSCKNNEFTSNNIMKMCIFVTHLKWETEGNENDYLI